MNTSLPDNLKSFVPERVNNSNSSTPSDHIQALILADKQHVAEQKLEQALLEGLSSRPSVPVDGIFWERLNQRTRGATNG